MSRRQRFESHRLVTGFTIVAGLAITLWLILSQVARPPGVAARSAGIGRQIAEAERLGQTASGPLVHPAGAVCRQSPAAAAAALQQRLQSGASANGLTVASLVVVPGAGDEALGGLTPITFTIEANGRYDAAVLLVAGLAKAQPEIFIDQADLKSQTSSVTLKLSGRLYCSISARL